MLSQILEVKVCIRCLLRHCQVARPCKVLMGKKFGCYSFLIGMYNEGSIPGAFTLGQYDVHISKTVNAVSSSSSSVLYISEALNKTKPSVEEEPYALSSPTKYMIRTTQLCPCKITKVTQYNHKAMG